MNLLDQFNYYLFSIGSKDILLSHVLLSLFAAVFLLGIQRFILKRILPRYSKKQNLDSQEHRRLVRVFTTLLFLVWVTLSFLVFELDFSIHQFDWGFDFRFSMILKGFLLFQVAFFIIRIGVESIHHNYVTHNTSDTIVPANTAIKQYKTFIFLLVLLALLNMFHLDFTLFNLKNSIIKISGILIAAIIIIGARVIAWILTEIVLAGFYRRSQTKKLDEGNRYAINRLLSYFIYTMAFFFALSAIGLNLTLLWGGAAALMVGVGLGLQQTFNDIFSGILLLFERSVEVGDWVEMEKNVGKVMKIGLRTSVVKSRNNISVIVPNSILVTQKVINWSHHDSRTRFSVKVSVAYGSDTQLVKKLLEEVANSHIKVLDKPGPKVRLIQFGESSLDFELLFWALHFHSIEDIKSDLRFELDSAFRKNNITIPFPQRDVFIK